jgi:ketosteroid isomerase-like protein
VVELFRDTEWTEAEGMPYGGVFRGADAILQNVLGPMSADVQGFDATPDEVVPVGDDRVLSLGTYRGQGSKGALAVPFAHLWTVQNGKIARFVQYADTHKFRECVGR